MNMRLQMARCQHGHTFTVEAVPGTSVLVKHLRFPCGDEYGKPDDPEPVKRPAFAPRPRVDFSPRPTGTFAS